MANYQTQPEAKIKATLDYKGNQIRQSQRDKEESIRLSSSGRDATIMVSTLLQAGDPQYRQMNETVLKEKILEWRKWFYQNIYFMSEEEYQNFNSPF